METLGTRLRKLREKRGREPREFAKSVGMAYSTLMDLENGHSKTTRRLHAIINELQTTAAYLEHGRGSPDADSRSGPLAPTLPVSPAETAPGAASTHLAALAARIQRAPPHVRELIGQALLRYAQHPDDAAIARSIEALLGPEESG